MKTTNSISASAKRSRPLRRILRGLSILVGCVLLLVAAGWGWLQSGPGKRWILGTLSTQLQGTGGQQFTMSGLTGLVPTDIHLDHLAIADQAGEWLSIRELDLAWSLSSLIRERKVHVRLLTVGSVRVDRLPAWKPADPPGGSSGGFTIPPVAIDGLRISHLLLGEDLVGAEGELGLAGAAQVDHGGRQGAGDLDVRDRNTDGAQLLVRAELDDESGSLDLAGTLTAPAGSFFARLLHSDPMGDLVVQIEGAGKTDSWSGDIHLQASRWGVLDTEVSVGWGDDLWVRASGDARVEAESLADFPGRASFAVEVHRAPEGAWVAAPEIRFAEDGGEIHGTLTIDGTPMGVGGSLRLVVPALQAWAEPLGYPVNGRASADVDVGWRDDRLALDIDLSGDEVAWADVGTEGLRLRTAMELGWAPQLWIHVNGGIQIDDSSLAQFPSDAAFTAAVHRAESGAWEVSPELTIETIGARLHGEITVGPGTTLVEGQAAMQVTGLRELTEPLGYAVEGGADLTVQLHGEEGRQSMSAALNGSDWSSAHATVGALTVEARIPDLRDLDVLTAEAQAQAVEIAGRSLDPVTLAVSRAGEDWTFQARTESAEPRPAGLEADGTLRVHPDGQQLAVEHLHARYEDVAISATAPVILEHREGRWTLEPVRIAGVGDDLHLEGHYAPDSIQLETSVTNLSLHALPVDLGEFPDGRLEGRLSITGTPADPAIDIALEIGQVTTPDLLELGFPGVGFAARATLADGRLVADARASDNPIGTLQAGLKLPATLSLQPFSFTRPKDEHLETELKLDLDLSYLNRLRLLSGHQVRGRITADLAYAGPAGEFALEGAAHLRDGSYEHFLAGTTIRDITADLTTQDHSLRLVNGSATDGEEGRILATGGIDLLPDQHFPFSIQVTATRATLIRQDHLTAAISSDLEVRGDLRSVSVDGEVRIMSGEFNIDRLPPAAPPVVAFVEVGEVPGEDPESSPTREAPRGPTRLKGDLKVVADGPFFVRGAGLDSAWQGAVRLQSDGGPWKVKGTFTPRRGRYEFFGRQFNLVNSAVHLQGSYPVMPNLAITAEHERPEIRTRLRITGPMNDPQITLESEPDYPQDEILARTMFGTSATSLTPLQTAQLGMAVASTARRRESTFDFMDRTRNRLSIDELGLRESAQDPNQVELVAGTFVSDRLFLEYSQRLGGDRDAGVRAEYEINRHLSIETSAGAQLRPGVRVNLKMDY